MAKPIFIVPGVVHSIITQNIAVRTITAVMEILQLAGPTPRHILQLSSRQMSVAATSQNAYANPFFYMHNNLCDSYYNPDEKYANCLTFFAGTLLSTYTSAHLRENKLLPLENSVLLNSNALQQTLHIDHSIQSLSTVFMCPKNILTERVRVDNGATVTELLRCRVCTDQQFWNENRCQKCDTNVHACEQYSRDT